MPEVSYGFAVGNIRAREVTLLKSTDTEQLLGLDFGALAPFLRDKGFFSGTDNDGDIFDMLENESRRLWEYLLSIVPDKRVFDAFLIPNDFHNLKVILKGTAKGSDFEHLLKEPTLFDTDMLKSAVSEKRFDLLEKELREPVQAAYDALFKDADVCLSDALLDSACMALRLNAARQTKMPLIEKIITASVFYANVKTALRCAKAGKGAAFLNAALTEDGIVDKKELISAATSGVDALLEKLTAADKLDSASAAAAYKKAPAELEKFIDNYIFRLAEGARYITVGGEVAVGYLISRQREIAAVRLIASGKKTKMDENEIRGRLRLA